MENFTKPIQRLAHYSKLKGVSLNKISTEIGVSNSYFSKMVRNDANIGSDIMEKILRAYNDINPAWFVLGEGNMFRLSDKTNSKENLTVSNGKDNGKDYTKNKKFNKPYCLNEAKPDQYYTSSVVQRFNLKTDFDIQRQQVPLYNIDASAGLISLFKDISNQTPIDFINIPNLPKCDGAIYVIGDSMYPLLKSGDIVVYKQINDILNNIFWGEMYLISIDMEGEEYVCVKYIQKSDQDEHVKLVSHNSFHSDKDIPFTKIKALAFVKASIHINAKT